MRIELISPHWQRNTLTIKLVRQAINISNVNNKVFTK